MTTEHSLIQSENCHEPKHITNATTSQAGMVITPSGVTAGTSELRRLALADLNGGEAGVSTFIQQQDALVPQGWTKLVDSLTTPTITINTTPARYTVNKLGTNTVTNRPTVLDTSGGDQWDSSNNKVVPVSAGDCYLVSLEFNVTAVVTATKLKIALDGGSVSTSAVYPLFCTTVTSVATGLQNVLAMVTIDTSTISAGGVQVLMSTDAGTVTVGARALTITRLSKGR